MTGAALTVSLDELTDPRHDAAPFSSLLARGLGEGRPLALALGAQGAEVRVDERPMDGAPVAVRGAWRSPVIESVTLAEGKRVVFLPLLMDVHGIRLGPEAISVVGTEGRSILAFFLRNLLFFGCGTGSAAIERSGAEDGDPRAAREVTRNYVFLLRTLRPDRAFEGRPADEVADMLLADAHCGARVFEDPFLQAAAARWRRTLHEPVAPREIAEDLLKVRDALLPHLAQ